MTKPSHAQPALVRTGLNLLALGLLAAPSPAQTVTLATPPEAVAGIEETVVATLDEPRPGALLTFSWSGAGDATIEPPVTTLSDEQTEVRATLTGVYPGDGVVTAELSEGGSPLGEAESPVEVTTLLYLQEPVLYDRVPQRIEWSLQGGVSFTTPMTYQLSARAGSTVTVLSGPDLSTGESLLVANLTNAADRDIVDVVLEQDFGVLQSGFEILPAPEVPVGMTGIPYESVEPFPVYRKTVTGTTYARVQGEPLYAPPTPPDFVTFAIVNQTTGESVALTAASPYEEPFTVTLRAGLNRLAIDATFPYLPAAEALYTLALVNPDVATMLMRVIAGIDQALPGAKDDQLGYLLAARAAAVSALAAHRPDPDAAMADVVTAMDALDAGGFGTSGIARDLAGAASRLVDDHLAPLRGHLDAKLYGALETAFDTAYQQLDDGDYRGAIATFAELFTVVREQPRQRVFGLLAEPPGLVDFGVYGAGEPHTVELPESPRGFVPVSDTVAFVALGDRAVAVDTDSGAILADIETGAGANVLAYAPELDRVLLVQQSEARGYVLDAGTGGGTVGTVTAVVELATLPTFAAATTGGLGDGFVVSHYDSPDLSHLQVLRGEKQDEVKLTTVTYGGLGSEVSAMATSAGREAAYLTSMDGKVAEVSLAADSPGAVLRTASVASMPTSLAAASAADRLYVLAPQEQTLYVYDLAADSKSDTLELSEALVASNTPVYAAAATDSADVWLVDPYWRQFQRLGADGSLHWIDDTPGTPIAVQATASIREKE